MDALDILARIDAGQPVTHKELGYLLPELERLGRIKSEMPQYCCDRAFARIYHFRGNRLLWVAGQIGYAQTGIVKVPARAVILSDMPLGFQLDGYITTTTCRKCGRGLHFFRDSLTVIAIVPGAPPTFATVVD
jgi:hypothetical protein